MSEATQTVTAQATETFEKMMRDWQNTTMENWGALTRQMVGAESFFHLMSATTDVYLSSIKQMRTQMNNTLSLFEVPQMGDLAKVSNQVLTAEARVVECEEQLDQARRQMAAMEQRVRELEALVQRACVQSATTAPQAAVAEPQLPGVDAPAPSRKKESKQ